MVLKSWRNKEKNSKKKIILELGLIQSFRKWSFSKIDFVTCQLIVPALNLKT
jgi:hypothetical protein